MALSIGQVQDLLALRCLLLNNLARLKLERNVLIHRLSKDYCRSDSVKAWAKRLQQNIDEEHQMYYQTVAATHFGVSALARLCYMSNITNMCVTACTLQLADNQLGTFDS